MMHRNMVFIIFFSMVVMIFTTSWGQCENWKEFFKDGDGVWYYDKDSIHYPKTKIILGLTVQNKEIVNVWTRYKESAIFGKSNLTQIYCMERVCEGCASGPFDPDTNSRGFARRESIEPGSWGESLLKKVCP